MHSFEVPDVEVLPFLSRVRDELTRRELDDLVTVRLAGSEIVVRFTKLGTTELRFAVSNLARGFRAHLCRSRIAPFHAPFQSGFEDRFEEMIQVVGARLL